MSKQQKIIHKIIIEVKQNDQLFLQKSGTFLRNVLKND